VACEEANPLLYFGCFVLVRIYEGGADRPGVPGRDGGATSGARSHDLLALRHRRFPWSTPPSSRQRRAGKMDRSQLSPEHAHIWAALVTPVPTDKPVSEGGMLLILVVCPLPILSLWTPFYLQIKRIRVVHQALVPISTRMFVGLIVTRLVPGNM
jgi:hypothetical protein